MKNDLNKIKKDIITVLKKYPIKKAGLFGSILNENFTDESDIDILVEIDSNNNKFSLFDFIGIQYELEDTLKRDVDLIEYKAIKPALKEYILPNELRIYDKNS